MMNGLFVAREEQLGVYLAIQWGGLNDNNLQALRDILVVFGGSHEGMYYCELTGLLLLFLLGPLRRSRHARKHRSRRDQSTLLVIAA